MLKAALLIAAYAAIGYGAYTQDYPVLAFGFAWLLLQRLDSLHDMLQTLMLLNPEVQKKMAELKAEKERM